MSIKERIVSTLREAPVVSTSGGAAAELADRLQVDRQKVTAALYELKKAGRVVTETRGKRTFRVSLPGESAVVREVALRTRREDRAEARRRASEEAARTCEFCDRTPGFKCPLHREPYDGAPPPQVAERPIVRPPDDGGVPDEPTVTLELPAWVAQALDRAGEEHDELVDLQGQHAAVVDELARWKATCLDQRELIGNLRAQLEIIRGSTG